MTDQEITPERKAAAQDRAEKIRQGIEHVAQLYALAVKEEDWRALGYSGVREWAEKELSAHRLSAPARQEIAALLVDAGYTVRHIAEATDVSPATISTDLASAGVQETNTTGNERQKAARKRESKRRVSQPSGHRSTPVSMTPLPECAHEKTIPEAMLRKRCAECSTLNITVSQGELTTADWYNAIINTKGAEEAKTIFTQGLAEVKKILARPAA